MARYLEVELDKKDGAAIKWLIKYSLKNIIQLPRIEAFAKMLGSDTSITCVDLSDSNIDDDGVRALADILKNNTTVTDVILQHNRIGAKAASSLAAMLKANKAITGIDLHQNEIGAQELAEMLKTNTTITLFKPSDRQRQIGN